MTAVAGLTGPEHRAVWGEGETVEQQKALAAPHRMYCTAQFLAVAKLVCPELYESARTSGNITGADFVELLGTLNVPAYGIAHHAYWYDGLTPYLCRNELCHGEVPTPGFGAKLNCLVLHDGLFSTGRVTSENLTRRLPALSLEKAILQGFGVLGEPCSAASDATPSGVRSRANPEWRQSTGIRRGAGQERGPWSGVAKHHSGRAGFVQVREHYGERLADMHFRYASSDLSRFVTHKDNACAGNPVEYRRPSVLIFWLFGSRGTHRRP